MAQRTDGTMNDDQGYGEPDRKETAEIRQEIERTRADMSRTVGEIEERLSPEHLKAEAKERFEDAKDKVRHSVEREIHEVKARVRDATVGRVEHMASDVRDTVTETGISIMDTIRENPIPSAMIAAGIGWLLVSSRKSGRSRSSLGRGHRFGSRFDGERRFSPYYDEGYDAEYAYRLGVSPESGYGVGAASGEYFDDKEQHGEGVIERGREAVSRAAQGVKSTASHLGERVGRGAQQVTGEARHLASEAGRRANRLASHTRHRVWHGEQRLRSLFWDNPLAVGAVVLAAGAALGLSLPHTEVEDEWFGEAKDRLVDRAQGVAQRAIQSVEGKVESLGEEKGSSSESATQPGRPNGAGSSLS